MSAKPRWAIAKVKDLGGRGQILVAHEICDAFPTRSEAVATLAEVLEDLRLADFARTDELQHCLADVYGVVVDGAGWYLKLTVAETGPAVLVISFHRLERPLRTKGGMVEP
jgi:hypothetical protein